MGPGQRPDRSNGGGPVASAVAISGDGVAAACAAFLLDRAGIPVNWTRPDRGRLPAIMLSQSAQELIRDVFSSPGLFSNAHPVTHREVAWQPGQTATFEHRAVVVSEPQLLSELPPPNKQSTDTPGFTLRAQRSPDSTAFGNRTATAFRATLAPSANPHTCVIESLDDGWLFLVPDSPSHGWLLSIGDAAPLERSTVIAHRIASLEAAGRFPCHPAICPPLTGDDWLACGSAAMAFDPICGDGTAHAVREAVLAAAVLRSAIEGESWPDLRAHYECRLLLGFRRHLALVSGFYRSARSTNWWTEQAEAADRGIAWCDERIRHFGPPKFRLECEELRRLG